MDEEAILKKRILELENENKILETTDKQKTEFFTHLAHESKTPLTLIKNYIEKYIKKTGMNEDLIIIKQNIDYLLRTITNFLDAEKIARGKIYYDHDQATDISSLIMNKIPIFKSLAENKHISIDTDIEPGIHIRIDPFAADRIINNLLDNAIKYTNTNGKVAIQLYRYLGNIVIKVTDNGRGMSKEQRKNLLLPFYEQPNKKQSSHGMGIGLFIVKEIIDSINADIRMESKIHKGTIISIIINKDRITTGAKSITSNDFLIPISKRALAAHLADEKTNPDKQNIFIIDDDKYMLVFLQSFLKDTYNIYLALNGKEALEKILVIPKPDVIIVDIIMDEMDGHSFLMHLYNMDEFADIPVIFLSARTSISDKIKGLSGGAIDYIYKPFNIDELKTKVHSIIRNRQAFKRNIIIQIEQLLMHNIKSNTYPEQTPKYNFQEICRRKRLSMRETEVMICMKDGLLNKEIGDRLNISISTVEYHLRNIYHKFNVQNRIELLNQLNAEGLR